MAQRGCPKCHGRLDEVQTGTEVSAQRCSDCGGVRLQCGLERWRELITAIPELESGDLDPGAGLSCPADGSAMTAEVYQDANGVRIHLCKTCWSVWIDRGDLSRFAALGSVDVSPILSAAAEVLSTPEAPAEEPEHAGHGRVVARFPLRLDGYFVALPLVPIAPAAILWMQRAEMSAEDAAALAPLLYGFGVVALFALVYLVAWIVSRATGERRLVITTEEVFLPAFEWRLSGRWVALREIESVDRYGTAGRRLQITFAGGARRLGHNVVDTAELAEQITAAVARARGIG